MCGVAELSADHRIATFAVPVAIGAVVAVCIRIRRHRSDRIVLLAILVVLILPLGSMLAAAPSRSAAGCFDAGRGRVCRSAGPPHLVVASVGADVDSFELLGALRAHGLSRVDLVVSTSSTEGAQVVLSQISERVAIGSVITPDQWCGDGPPTPMLRTFSTMNVSIRCDGDRLEVSLTEQSDQER